MKLSIIGTGHIGLVTAACFADHGHSVIGVDNDEAKINLLKSGQMPIYEPGLDAIVRKNVDAGRLSFSGDIGDGVRASDVIFITVGTPAKANGGSDLSYVDGVAQDIARSLDGYKVIVEKSTVPVRTGERIRQVLRLYNRSAKFDLASVPEFLREGSAVADFMNPDRIVIGVDSPRAEAVMREIFQPIAAKLVVTDVKSAELIKHASNSFLALKISYINAVATLCEKVGADVEKVAEGMGADRRIGREFLNAGVGYGGYCFPKDVAAFINIAEDLGYQFDLLKAVAQINQEQRLRVVSKLQEVLWTLKGKTICVLGLSFKPNTDDVRDAPAIEIIQLLQAEGATVKAYDPAGMKNASELVQGVEFCKDPYEAATGAHAVAVLTEWPEFKQLDMERLRKVMTLPVLIDGRNIYIGDKLRALGFEYRAFGRS